MKAIGIVRNLDDMGRIVLPMEIRRSFDINEKDEIEILVNNDSIVLRKYGSVCIFCHGNGATEYKGKNVCSECLEELKNE